MKTFKKLFGQRENEPFEYHLNFGEQFAHLAKDYNNENTRFWLRVVAAAILATGAIIINCIIQLSNH